MIKTIVHKGLRRFFQTVSAAGVQPHHTSRLRTQLAILNNAETITDVDLPSFRLHRLQGRSRHRWSISVNGNWRLTFEFREGDVYFLNYEDYH